MKSNGSRKDASNLLPEGAEPCVWMRAGLIAYKLCDRDFDCESCPLDAALRGDANSEAHAAATEAPAASPAPLFPEDRRYHRSHAWIEQVDDGRCRFGMDAVAARLLAHARKIVLPPVKTHLSQGRTAWWVLDDEVLIPLPSPLSGTVLRVNPRLADDPSLLAAAPYDDGWLVEARGRSSLDDQPNLLDAEQQARHTATQLARIGRHVARIVGSDGAIGPTLADGGEHLTDLRQILGAQRYRRLVLSILY